MSFRNYICNLYGQRIYQLANELKRTKIKLAKIANHIVFLKRCRDAEFFPSGLRIRTSLQQSRKSKTIVSKAEAALVREKIHFFKQQRSKETENLNRCSRSLHEVLNERDFSTVESITDKARNREFSKIKETHQKKFLRLEKQAASKCPAQSTIKDPIVNLSGVELSRHELEVLEKGLGFAPTPAKIPIKEIICATESALKEVKNPMEANATRSKIAAILKSATPPKDNLTKQERIALRSLQSRPDIVILPADKGNTVVVLSKGQYAEKLGTLLSDRAYKEVQKDPTSAKERGLKCLIKSLKDKQNMSQKLAQQLMPSHSSCPRLYGLPKIHKPDVPLRPITCMMDSPAHKTAAYLTKVISPVLGKSEYTVKNSAAFVGELQTLTLTPEDRLVSFDVTSLFTRVPTAEAVDIICRKLDEDETLADRCELPVQCIRFLMEECLKCSYFKCQERYFLQLEGAPMGLSLSVVLANAFMEALEEELLGNAAIKPKYWRRYVDDTFIVWPHGLETIEQFLQYLNSASPSIQFTVELEREGRLPFLDVEVVRSETGILMTSVFRKPTCSNVYLKFDSHHATCIKSGTIRGLAHRASVICNSDEARETELTRIRQVFRENGYPINFIERALHVPSPCGPVSTTATTDRPVTTAAPSARAAAPSADAAAAAAPSADPMAAAAPPSGTVAAVAPADPVAAASPAAGATTVAALSPDAMAAAAPPAFTVTAGALADAVAAATPPADAAGITSTSSGAASAASPSADTMAAVASPSGTVVAVAPSTGSVTTAAPSQQLITSKNFRYVSMPYVKGISERISRALLPHGTRVGHNSRPTIRNLLCRPKDPIAKEHQKGAIYKTSCQCGASYIGESGRPKTIRLKEHVANIKHQRSDVSPLAEHWANCKENFDPSQAVTLATEPHWYRRVVRESIEIRAHNPVLNQGVGKFTLSPIWDYLLKG